MYYITLILALVLLPSKGENISDVQRVLDDFFSPTVYNKMIRGINDQTKPVTVDVKFYILSVADFNEVEETLEVIGVLHIIWVDERLVWDPDDYNGVKVVHAYQNTVWKAEVVVANSAKAVKLFGDERIMTTHHFNGTALWRVGELLKVHCSLDVTAYPWDHQTCYIDLMVWGYQPQEVNIVASSDGILLTYFEGNGAWELTSAKTVDSEWLPTTKVSFSLELRRYPLYSVVNIFMPILTLIILNILGFLIPPSSGEKLSYCITVLLALGVFLSIVSAHLPKNSNNMAALCFFLMFVLLMSAIICACSVLSVHLYHKAESSSPPLWLRQCVYKLTCRNKVQHSDEDNSFPKEFKSDSLVSVKDENTVKTCKRSTNGSFTWLDVSKYVDYISFVTTIVWLCVSTAVFAYYINSR